MKIVKLANKEDYGSGDSYATTEGYVCWSSSVTWWIGGESPEERHGGYTFSFVHYLNLVS